MQKLKFGICGFGYWNHYARILSESNDAELVMVCDLKQENLDKAKAQYPNIKTTTNLNDLIHSDIQNIIVATPVTTHYSIVKEFLIAGKNILCEKAFTKTEDEAQALIDIADGMGSVLAVGHTYLHNYCVKEIKECIDNKEFGDIYYVSMTRVGMSPQRMDVNAMYDLGAHDISMLLYWFGEMPKSVNCQGYSYLKDGIEDVCFANLQFSNGVMANIKCSWLNPTKRRIVTIVGSEMMSVFDDMEKTVEYYNKEGNPESTYIDNPDIQPLTLQVNDFIESIQQNRKPKVTGEDGMNVVKVLEQCQQSMNKNK